jgi:hypothetical protein
MESKWINFVECKDTGKTKYFNVVTKDDIPFKLGEVKWFGRWRQYSFFPESNTVFEKQCLKDIINFIENLMLERKNKKND